MELQLTTFQRAVLSRVRLRAVAAPKDIAYDLQEPIGKVYKALYELSDIPDASAKKKPYTLNLLVYKPFSNNQRREKFATLTHKGEQIFLSS